MEHEGRRFDVLSVVIPQTLELFGKTLHSLLGTASVNTEVAYHDIKMNIACFSGKFVATYRNTCSHY
jgi:hypothetical protein